jgi:pimeloyl-ACP methyl ester carboxylesterase
VSADPQEQSQATVVLLHSAFAESASWNDVICRLQDRGYTAIAAANPLRSVAGDAEFVASILGSLSSPIVLVGHSYGGAVITNAARDNQNVKALVYVAGFAPDEGENNLHRGWFDRPENAHMFRPAFREYIAKIFPKPDAAPVAAAS